METQQRYRGALIGLAVGDAVARRWNFNDQGHLRRLMIWSAVGRLR